MIGFTATASDADVPPEVLTFTLEDRIRGVSQQCAVITAGGVFSVDSRPNPMGPGVYSFDVAWSLMTRVTEPLRIAETFHCHRRTEANIAPVLDSVGPQSGDEGTLDHLYGYCD